MLQVCNNVDKLNGDITRVFAIGGSAGGSLALCVTDQLIKAGQKELVKGVVAMAPVAAHPESIPKEYASEYTAYEENATGVPVIDADSMRIFFECVSCPLPPVTRMV